jgi:hypothetical protein
LNASFAPGNAKKAASLHRSIRRYGHNGAGLGQRAIYRFSHLVSLGDMADVDFGDMLDYLASIQLQAPFCLYRSGHQPAQVPFRCASGSTLEAGDRHKGGTPSSSSESSNLAYGGLGRQRRGLRCCVPACWYSASR